MLPDDFEFMDRDPSAVGTAEQEEIVRLLATLGSSHGPQASPPTLPLGTPAMSPPVAVSAELAVIPGFSGSVASDGVSHPCSSLLGLKGTDDEPTLEVARAESASIAPPRRSTPPRSRSCGSPQKDATTHKRSPAFQQSFDGHVDPAFLNGAPFSVRKEHDCLHALSEGDGGTYAGWPNENSRPRLCSNASMCVGQWTDNLLDGYGIERWPDGSVFVGDFCKGEKHGRGRFVWATGCVYEGEFERDTIHGEGVHVWSDGRGYTGQWRYGRVGPSGSVRWSDGRVYHGEVCDARIQGYGTLRWPEGRSYTGQWFGGKQHGVGFICMDVAAGAATGVLGRESLWRDGSFVGWLNEPPADIAANDEPLTSGWEASFRLAAPRSYDPASLTSPRGVLEKGSPPVGETSRVMELTTGICSAGRCVAVDHARQNGLSHFAGKLTRL